MVDTKDEDRVSGVDTDGCWQGLPDRRRQMGLRIKTSDNGPVRHASDIRDLFDLAPVPHQALDSLGCIVEVNAAWLAAMGYLREEIIGRAFRELLMPEYGLLFARSFKHFKLDGMVANQEFHLKRKDGSPYPVLLNGVIERNTDGTFHCLSCVLEDLSENRRSQQRLERVASQLQEVQEMARLGTWKYDIDSGITEWPALVYEICGLDDTTATLTLAEFQKHVHSEDISVFLSDIRLAIEEGLPYSHELRVISQDGAISYILNQGQAYRDESDCIVGLLGIIQDRTERTLSEQALRDRDAELAAMYDNASFIIALIDGDKRIIKANARAAVFADKDESNIIGMRCGDAFGCYNAENSPLGCGRSPACGNCEVSRALTDTFISGRTYQNREVRLPKRVNGSRQEIIFLISTTRLTCKSEPCVLASMLDITEQRRVQLEHVEMEKHMLHTQKLESLGLLAGGIAHDFNNLLMVVMGNMELAMKALPANSQAMANVDDSLKAASKAADLTRQMLAYSGRGSFKVSGVDLSVLVEEYAHLFHAVVPKTITMDLELTDSLPLIQADAGRLQQVVMNLITNASEAIGDRPGRIILSTCVVECDKKQLGKSRLDIKPSPGRYVSLEVSDTGCGMDENTANKLFDPFFTTKITGRGLGMSAVMGIVRSHGGALMIDSKPFKGTSITILFPADAAERLDTVKPISDDHRVGRASSSQATSGTVLVIDDDEMVRHLCMTMVSRMGYKVIGAADGRAGLDLFSEQADDIVLVILDISMPVMSGHDALRGIRRIKTTVPVLLASGFGENYITDNLHNESAVGFIQKPYSYDTLKKEIEQVLTTALLV